jgi:hypothetical protein
MHWLVKRLDLKRDRATSEKVCSAKIQGFVSGIGASFDTPEHDAELTQAGLSALSR